MPGVAGVLIGAAGLACLARAVRALRPPRTPRLRRRVVPRLLDLAAGRLDRVPALRRHGDDDALRRRLALAPDAWPWRLVGAASAPDDAVAVARLVALRAAVVVVATLAAVLALVLARALALPAVAAPVGLGVAGLDLITASAARKAERRLVVALPDALDCLATALEAGLVLEQALQVAAGAADPPLDGLLRRVLAAIRLGDSPSTAFRREADRSGVPAVVAAAAVVERSRRLGEPAAPTMLAMAADARAEAAARAAVHSARRSSLAALVVAVVITPACVVAVMAVLIGGLLGAGQGPAGG